MNRDDLSATNSDLSASTEASGAHTPEPWHAPGLGEIHSANHEDIAQICFADPEYSACGTEEDARRIVACINAAEGISTEALEASKDFAKAGIATVRSIEAQRDELAEALHSAVEVIKTWHNMDGSEDVWQIYYDHAPEMKPIREALTTLDNGTASALAKKE